MQKTLMKMRLMKTTMIAVGNNGLVAEDSNGRIDDEMGISKL